MTFSNKTSSNESLSAFLDGELPEDQMEEVRDAVADDPDLARRLAQLSEVDRLVRMHAEAIDTVPTPDSINRLLAQDNVVDLSLWNRTCAVIGKHAALAASLALLIGFSAGYIGGSGTPHSSPSYMVWLDTAVSGTPVVTDADTQLTARFTFVDRQQRYCRQFQLQSGSVVSENVACREQEGWTLVATARTSHVFPADEYQLASGGALLDSALDAMMPGSAMSLEEEQALIRAQWQ